MILQVKNILLTLIYVVPGDYLIAARCEVVNNINGEVRNIYWDYKIKLIDVKWINDNTISINGHKINVENEVYDWRKV